MTAPAPVLSVLCSPWATVADLEATPRLPERTDEQWERLLWRSSEILYALSGRQWTGGGCESTVRFGRVRLDCLWWIPADVAWPVPGLLDWPTPTGPWHVQLPAAPVTGVTLVQIDGAALTAGADYSVHLSSGLLERHGRPWPTDGSLHVTYTYGLPPPRGGVDAAARLAVELALYELGDEACRLPSNAVSVTREGITISMARPGAERGSSGLTGLVDVDMWLHAVNPQKLTRRSSVWTPDVPNGRRMRP